MRERPDAPGPVKRTLRQQAGFGCCICGYPLYEYHHIIPYASEHHFRPGDMMVLCPNHHTEATNGILDEAEQRRYKANPYNITHGIAQGALAVKQTSLAIALGSNQFVGNGTFIRVDNHPLLSLSLSADGRLQVSVELNDCDGNLLALIDKNEWITGDSHPWDLEYGGRWLRIRRQQREVSLYIDARPKVVEVRGSLWFNQHHFSINKDAIAFDGPPSQPEHSSIRDIGFTGCQFEGAGLVATTNPPGLAVAFLPSLERGLSESATDTNTTIERTHGVEQVGGTAHQRAGHHVRLVRRPVSQMPLPHKRRKQS